MNAGIYHKDPLPYCNYGIIPDNQRDNCVSVTNGITSWLPLEFPFVGYLNGQCKEIESLSRYSRHILGDSLHMLEVPQAGYVDYNLDDAQNIVSIELFQGQKEFFYKLCRVRDYHDEISLPNLIHNIADRDHVLRMVYQDDILLLGINHHLHFFSMCYSSKHINRVPYGVYRDDILLEDESVYYS